MKQITTLFCLFFIATLPLQHLYSGSSQINIFKSTAVGAKTLSLGRTPVARSMGVEAANINPALYKAPNTFEFLFNGLNSSILEYSIINFGFAWQVNQRVSTAFTIVSFDIEDIIERDASGTHLGVISADQNIMTLGTSLEVVPDSFKVGANFNASLGSEFKSSQSDGFTLDVGIAFGSKDIKMGVSWLGLELFNSSQYFTTDSFSYDIRLGPSITIPLPSLLKGSKINLDGAYQTASQRLSISAEGTVFQELFALRTSAALSEGKNLELFGGGGVRYKTKGDQIEIGVDYAIAKLSVDLQHLFQVMLIVQLD